jgi:hypothetical protein
MTKDGKAKNYHTQVKFINDELARLALITDRGTRCGEYYALQDFLRAEARQWGGHYMGIGKACSEGWLEIDKLIDDI